MVCWKNVRGECSTISKIQWGVFYWKLEQKLNGVFMEIDVNVYN